MYCDLPELGRCCFCLPLRKGVIAFGYATILFNAFLLGLYSYIVHRGLDGGAMSFGKLTNLPVELSITICCAEIVFAAVLVYAAHTKSVQLLRIYYYFALTTAAAELALQIIGVSMLDSHNANMAIELLMLAFAGLCMQVYLIIIIRSLLKKFELSGPHVYDNQLHQIVSGEARVENNGVYKDTTAPTDI